VNTNTIEVCLFPLNTVVFPGGLLPLRIFEPRYLRMVRECLTQEQSFAVLLIREGGEAGAPAQFNDLGTLASIVDFDQREDGLLGITAQGQRRLRTLSHQVASDRLISGLVELLPEEEPVPLAEEYQGAADLLQRIVSQLPAPLNYPEADFGDACWVSGRLAELLPLPLSFKQDLLNLDSAEQRMDVLFGLLQEQDLV
jgi:Lon protease-like protein